MRAVLVKALARFWPRSIRGRAAFGLLTIAGTLVSVPVLLSAMIVGSHVAGALWGAVNVFNSPSSAPSAQEMVGSYSLRPKSAKFLAKLASARIEPSELELKPYGKAEFRNVYEYLESFDSGTSFSLCQISGRGTWQVTSNGGAEVSVHLLPEAVILGGKACTSEAWVSYEVLGRGRAHRLWSYIGDPDSDTGLEYGGNLR